MTARRPTRIVTLPGRSVAELRSQIPVAKEGGGDWAEVRVDRLASGEVDRLAQLFPSPLPLLATCRSRAEGGEGPDGSEHRQPLLASLARLPFDALDLEVERDGPVAGVKAVVASIHAPVLEADGLHRRLASPSGPRWFTKVVLPATLREAIERIVPQLPAPGESSFVVHTTGGSGALLRAWAGAFGMAAVYCAMPGTAPGGVEPSQIPVDRMRAFEENGGPPRLFGVVGTPIVHSRSPDLHARWFADAGQRGLYVPLEVTSEEEFVLAVERLPSGGFSGLNVTHPWKAAALVVATSASPGATRCGCANTLTFEQGQVRAENTDLLAMLRRLEELRAEGRWEGSRLTVWGTGGAARATLAAAEAVSCEAKVVGRDRSAAERLAHEFGATAARWDEAGPTPLLVNATTVGRAGAEPLPPSAPGWLNASTTVLDFVYAPDDPVLEHIARAAGARYEGGWKLLVYQAAASYREWWGMDPSGAALEAVLREGA